MKKCLLLFFLAVTTVSLYGQQESHFTHFMYNQSVLNPAAAGSKEVPSFTAIYRNQWLDIDGAPKNLAISYSSPFFLKRIGFGLNAVRQQVGIFENWYTGMAYSYELKIKDELSVRIGLQAAAIYNNINFADERNIFFSQEDPSIMAGETSQLKANFGAGLYVDGKNFYFGVSSPYFLSNQIGFNEVTTETATKISHLYAMAGMILPINEKMKFRPSFLGKYVNGAPFQLDANLSVIYDNKISAGISYRTGGSGKGESIDFLLYYQLTRKTGIGAAYDFGLSEVADYQNGTIEVMLRHDLKSQRDDLENGRFFLN
jgi:type IX secretion system PorP/SprF family membrane protein